MDLLENKKGLLESMMGSLASKKGSLESMMGSLANMMGSLGSKMDWLGNNWDLWASSLDWLGSNLETLGQIPIQFPKFPIHRTNASEKMSSDFGSRSDPSVKTLRSWGKSSRSSLALQAFGHRRSKELLEGFDRK